MKDLTKQEKILIALLRGNHLDKNELEIAKQQVHILKLSLKRNNTMTTTEQKIYIKYCDVDRLFYIDRNGETIHTQKQRPTQTDIIEALQSDNWKSRFDDMRSGKKVRVSERIYFDMLCSVPPIKQTANSFYCGEPYSGNLHYFFYLDENDGKRYGQLKPIQ